MEMSAYPMQYHDLLSLMYSMLYVMTYPYIVHFCLRIPAWEDFVLHPYRPWVGSKNCVGTRVLSIWFQGGYSYQSLLIGIVFIVSLRKTQLRGMFQVEQQQSRRFGVIWTAFLQIRPDVLWHEHERIILVDEPPQKAMSNILLFEGNMIMAQPRFQLENQQLDW